MRPAVRRIALLGIALAAIGCRSPRQSEPGHRVRIAAASDLRFALEEVVRALRHEKPEIDLQASYGSSGTFYAQLLNGAPFDLFMSADVGYPRQLAAHGLTAPGSEFTYAIGRLIVWAPVSSPINVEQAGVSALVDQRVSHVAIANPAHAPYGRAAEEAMRRAGLYDAVKPKLVLGENVAQALQFVQSGAADAGVVALSLALAPTAAGQGRYWIVPAEWYQRLEQGGVILRNAIDLDAARQVRAYLLADQGRQILRRYGFFLPGA